MLAGRGARPDPAEEHKWLVGVSLPVPPPVSCPDSSGIKGKEKGRSEAVAGAEPPALRLQPPWGAELSPPPHSPPQQLPPHRQPQRRTVCTSHTHSGGMGGSL